VDWKLELLILPVADVDRAKAFYMDTMGFGLDVDHSAGEDFRIVQLTPPGSACSITLMRNAEKAGNAQGMHLIVDDIVAARAEIVGRGAEVAEIVHFVNGVETPGVHEGRGDYESFMFFNDPDGNGWVVQEVPSRR
jgi:catechol 2,3-dioxygenase-like lactoylglutathione lyase family enzyme